MGVKCDGPYCLLAGGCALAVNRCGLACCGRGSGGKMREEGEWWRGEGTNSHLCDSIFH